MFSWKGFRSTLVGIHLSSALITGGSRCPSGSGHDNRHYKERLPGKV
jgi:hypothetical protein